MVNVTVNSIQQQNGYTKYRKEMCGGQYDDIATLHISLSQQKVINRTN